MDETYVDIRAMPKNKLTRIKEEIGPNNFKFIT